MQTLLVGAGGLGGPIALALHGRVALTIVDPDVVDVTNLHRQVQFTDTDLGAAKAPTLAARAGGTGRVGRWPTDDDDPWQLAIDASDDPATKFAVCDRAVDRARPYVIASALRYGGNVFVGAPGSACYRCLFEEPPTEAPTCADAGVLGPVVGAIGGLAAALALRLVAGDLRDAGSIYVVDDLRVDRPPRVVRFAQRRDCRCAER